MPRPVSIRSGSEYLRKPLSFIIAFGWLAVAVVLMPRGFGEGWHVVMEQLGFLLLILAALGRIWSYAFIGGRKIRSSAKKAPTRFAATPSTFSHSSACAELVWLCKTFCSSASGRSDS